ncbi:MAG: tetratricopeptide repeat protein [Pseudomonadota bacterium]
MKFRSLLWTAFVLAPVALASAQGNGAPPAAGSAAPRTFQRFEAFSMPQAQVDQAYVSKLREEIQILNRLALTRKDPNAKADILYRIAEDYLLYDKAIYFRQMVAYQQQMDLFTKGKTKTVPKEPKFTPVRAFKLFENIVATSPKYDRLDEVLFRAGFYGQDVGSKDVDKYYLRVIHDYPKSHYRLDSYMQLGDYHFQHRQLDKAVDDYKMILREPSKLYNFALYQLGWCYYNQGKVRAANTVMQEVVKSSKGVQNEIELREEALKDLVVFYADLGLIEEAQQYFVSIGEPDYALKVLEKLSETYFSQARYDKAIETIRRLIAARPYAENTPKNHSRLVECYEKSQQLDKAMREMQVFVVSYDRNSLWFKQVTDSDAREYALERAEVYARFLPKKYHELAQQTARMEPHKSAEYMRTALVFYKKYLDQFGDNKNAYEMRFLYAELLFKEKNYAEAAKEYELVAKSGSKGKRHKEALLGQIDALSRLEEAYFKDIEAKGIKQKGKFDPIPLSGYAQLLVEADEAYVRAFPKDPKVPDTLLHRSQIYYNYNQFDRAQKGFWGIINTYPDSSASSTSRHLVLDILNIHKDWESLEKTASQFLADPKFATADNRALLLKLIQGSIFQRAKDMEEKKKYREAADTYMRLTTKYPTSEFADKAMYNAAIDYINADEAEKAMQTAQAFLARFPNSELVPKMMAALASHFDDNLDYVHAAYYYELLATKDPKSPLAPDSLFNAGLYRENLRHYDKALEDYRTYLEKYPKAKDASEIFFSTGLVYEKRKDWRETAATFKAYPQRPGSTKERNIEAYFRLGNALAKLKNEDGAARSYQTALAFYKRYNQESGQQGSTIGGRYAAKSRFELLKKDMDEYMAIRLRMPQRVLAAAIEQKARLLAKIKDRYLEIINYGDAEMGVGALYQIGVLYQNFAQALFNAPVPKGLTPEELQTYQQELQNRAAPIEAKAAEAYETAFNKAVELEVYNEWAKKAHDRLTEYKSDKYPPMRGRSMYANHVSEPLAPYKPSAKAGQL